MRNIEASPMIRSNNVVSLRQPKAARNRRFNTNDALHGPGESLRRAWTFVLLVAVVLSVFGAASGRTQTLDVETEPFDASDLARGVLMAYCGSCHRSDLPDFDPAAVATFDLIDHAWADGLSHEQWAAMDERVREFGGISEAERNDLLAFVATQLQRGLEPRP